MVQRQAELLSRRLFLLTVTTATNMIDQLQHLMAQLHKLLGVSGHGHGSGGGSGNAGVRGANGNGGGEEQKPGLQSASLGEGPPSCYPKSKRAQKPPTPSLQEWEERLDQCLRQARSHDPLPAGSFPVLPHPVPVSLRQRDQTVALIGHEVASLLTRFPELMVAWESYSWGFSVRLQFREARLGARLPNVYPSEAHSCVLVPLSPEARRGFYRRVVEEEDWVLFSPVSLTSIVSLLVYSIQHHPQS